MQTLISYSYILNDDKQSQEDMTEKKLSKTAHPFHLYTPMAYEINGIHTIKHDISQQVMTVHKKPTKTRNSGQAGGQVNALGI